MLTGLQPEDDDESDEMDGKGGTPASDYVREVIFVEEVR
jgi:hypothetical protein